MFSRSNEGNLQLNYITYQIFQQLFLIKQEISERFTFNQDALKSELLTPHNLN